METSGPHDLPRALHADDRWLRDLSRRLLRDTALADDAVQETWLSVMRSPPRREDGIGRGFLATALRNVIGKLRRGDLRRAVREAAYATSHPDHEAPLRGVIEQLELRKVMLDSVLGLPDVYRDVLLRRFYEDLPVATIALQGGVSIATVKTRLRRAEEMLAAKLDARANGDRTTYLPALIATAQPTLGSALLTSIAGVLAMAAKQKLTFAAIAVLVGAAGVALFESIDRKSDPAVAPAHAASPEMKLDAPSIEAKAPAVEATQRSAVPAVVDGVKKRADSAASPTRSVDGFVFDALGKPLPLAALRFVRGERHDDPPIEFAADTAGRFHVDVPREAAGAVEGADERLATVFEGVVQAKSQQIAPVVVLATRLGFAGIVVDHDSRPIAAASLQVELPRTFRERIPAPTENARERQSWAHSGSDGMFAMDSVPLVDGSKMLVAATGFPSIENAAPQASDGSLRFVLERPPAGDKSRVRGQVVDSFGAPVQGASVMLGFAFDSSDERGFFDLDTKQALKATSIRAVRQGSMPAELKWPLDPPGDFVTLTLGPPSVSIRGIVRYADGSPAAHLSVQPSEPEILGFFEGQMKSLEEAAGGYEHGVETDAHGAFELGGLLRKTYVLRILSLERGFAVRTAPILADGPSTTIDLPADLAYEKVRGKIVDRHGAAIAGATVSIVVTYWKTSYMGSINAANNGFSAVVSGPDGRFTLADVPRSEAEISARSEAILPSSIPVPPDAGEKEIEIVAERRCHFTLELPESDPATSFTALDDQGKALDLTVEQANETAISSSRILTAGKSGVVIVSDRATTLVLHKGEKELRRISIVLKAGETTAIKG